MKQIKEIIDKLEATSSRKEKEAILAKALEDGHMAFFHLAHLAYNPLMTFGVKKVPEILEDDGLAGTFSFQDFLTLAERLSNRTLTGNDAKFAIQEAAMMCDMGIWNSLYRRVLLRDLRCGIDAKTINKVLGDSPFSIPSFNAMLAHDSLKNERYMTGRKMLGVKLDGVRLLAIINKEERTVKTFTRNGLENENFPHITIALMGLLDILPGSAVLDGEVVSRNFQELMTQVNRKSGTDTRDARLAVFDLIPLADFLAGYCATCQKDRHIALSNLSGHFQELTGGSVYVLSSKEVDLDTEAGQAEFRSFNNEALMAGYEGVMIKDPHGVYEGKRSRAWLKLKPTITLDMTVMSVLEGEAGKQFAGSLGALVGRCVEDGKVIVSNVGSGFTIEQRAEIFANREEVIGQVMEVMADAITQDRNGEWSLRFPRFVRWRSIHGEKGVKD